MQRLCQIAKILGKYCGSTSSLCPDHLSVAWSRDLALERWMATSEVYVLEVFQLQIIALPDLVVASTACIARVDDTNSSTLVIKPQTRAWLQTANFSPTLRWNIKKAAIHWRGMNIESRSESEDPGAAFYACVLGAARSMEGPSMIVGGRTSQYCGAARVDAVARSAQRRLVRFRLPASNSDGFGFALSALLCHSRDFDRRSGEPA
jgi:hypothetical protein